MSSDGMQISVMSPWINLYYVVTGKNARGQLINADQTMDRKTALRAEGLLEGGLAMTPDTGQ